MKAIQEEIDQFSTGQLNSREREILALMAKGLTNREIAGKLHLSIETIKWYNKHLFLKLSVSSRRQAVAKALDTGILENPPSQPNRGETHPLQNLPASITSFVGRGKEIQDILRLFETNRLVVLTGPGGSGKTRLALEVARKLIGKYRDGVWWIELAALTDPNQVASSVATILGLASQLAESHLTILKRYLSHRNLLLVLDNFEHLLEAASLVNELLASAMQVSILATSRENLHVYGEMEYPVLPLPLPDMRRRSSLQEILRNESVQLFIQRAQGVRYGKQITNTEATTIAEICIHLDGLPLALELAASQTKIYSLSQVADQTRASLAFLTMGPRNAPARQQTLRAAIEWSHSLLSEKEKILFRRLAIFQGGGTLDAVLEVCTGSELQNIPETLTALVDKNMVIPREMQDGELHFIMLETIRQYALECLEKNAEIDDLHLKHAVYYLMLAEKATRQFRGENQANWFARLGIERENLRAALQWLSKQPDPDDFLRLITALGDFWYYDGQMIAEAQDWAELALVKASSATKKMAGLVGLTAGRIAIASGNQLRGREYLLKARNTFQDIGDENQAAWSAVYVGASYCCSKEEAIQGIALCKEGLEYFRRVNDRLGISQALNILGELSRVLRNYNQAKQFYTECSQISAETHENVRFAMQHVNLGIIAYCQNQPGEVKQFAKEALYLYREIHNDWGVITSFPVFAASALLSRMPARAARLLGAAQTRLDDLGGKYQPVDQIDIDQIIQETKRLLGETDFRKGWEEGSDMTFSEAIAYALEEVAVN